MKTRPATLADLDALIAQAQSFIDESPYKDKVTPVGEDFYADLAMKVDVGILIVAEANDGTILGSIGGVFIPWSSNHAVTIAYENWLYLDPSARGSGLFDLLVDAFEARARERGCALAELTCMNNKYMGILSAAYQRRGYALAQLVHTKLL